MTLKEKITLALNNIDITHAEEIISNNAGVTVNDIIECHKNNIDIDGLVDTSIESPAAVLPPLPAAGEDEKKPEPEIDYKKLYESTKLDLEAAQKSNSMRAVEVEEKSENDILKDIFKDFM